MKRIILLMLGVAGGCIAYADSARGYFNKLDAQTGLYLFSARSDVQPKKGCVYQNALTGILKVCQTVDGYCTARSEQPDANLIAIKPTSEYADGTFLREGYYQYVGLTAFTGIGGTPRQFHTFKEIESSIGDEIGRIASAKQELQMEIERSVKLAGEVQAVKRKLAEEVEAEKVRAKNERLKLENEREISRLKVEQQKAKDEIAAQKRHEQKELKPKLQKEREAYAKSLIKEIDFNVRHHYVVQHSIRKMIKKDFVADPILLKLADLQAKEDWLGMLSLIDDEEYDEYPKETIIDSLLRNVLQREYSVTFEIGKIGYGRNPVRFIHKKNIKFAGGSEDKWEEERTRAPGTVDPHEYGQENVQGTYKFVAKWRMLSDRAFFCHDDPAGASTLAGYRRDVLKRKFGSEVTEADVESYGEWLKEN